MNTYNKTLNIIDYSVMGLLLISAILVNTTNIPHAETCFIVIFALSVCIFISTSIKSKLYNISVPIFILDLFCKINIFGGVLLWDKNFDGKSTISLIMPIVFVIYLIDSLLTKKAPVYRSVSYLLIYAIVAGIGAAITISQNW